MTGPQKEGLSPSSLEKEKRLEGKSAAGILMQKQHVRKILLSAHGGRVSENEKVEIVNHFLENGEDIMEHGQVSVPVLHL